MSIMNDLIDKDVDLEKIGNKIIKNKKLLKELIDYVSSDKASIKYKSLKVLTFLSEKQPNIIYPKWDFFVKLLDNENTFLRAIGARIIANLTLLDTKNKFKKIFNKYYGLLNDKSMINAANVADYSGIIAQTKPDLQDKITDKLISIDETHHSQECKNIIKGKIILSFEKYIDDYDNKKKIIDFVEKELKNSRNATCKKAEKFIKKWEK